MREIEFKEKYPHICINVPGQSHWVSNQLDLSHLSLGEHRFIQSKLPLGTGQAMLVKTYDKPLSLNGFVRIYGIIEHPLQGAFDP